MAKRYYWLKLPDGFFRQKAIKKLRKIAGGDTYTIIYLKMLLVAMKQDGRLYFEGVEATFYDELALDLDEEVENVRVTVMFLIQQDLMISCGVIMLMIDTTTISIVCWAIPDLFDRIGCDVLIFFHGIEQVFTNWQTPTIFSASDCKGIINNFLPTIHEVYQSAQRGCCMVRSINMDMDTT